MNTREKILEAVLKNQPPSTALPDISMFKGDNLISFKNTWTFLKRLEALLF